MGTPCTIQLGFGPLVKRYPLLEDMGEPRIKVNLLNQTLTKKPPDSPPYGPDSRHTA